MKVYLCVEYTCIHIQTQLLFLSGHTEEVRNKQLGASVVA
jgi:hypothetical protein